MLATAGIASHQSIPIAIREAFEQASSSLRSPASLMIVFVSGERLAEQVASIQKTLRTLAPGVPVFGCSAESIVGVGLEIECKSAASVLLFSEELGKPTLFAMECMKTLDGVTVLGYKDDWIQAARERNGLVVLACPKTFSIDILTESLAGPRNAPVNPILGGYCSSQNWNETNLLFCDDRVVESGAVALVLPDGVQWQSIVSQGCRPIGEPLILTKLDRSMVLGLGGKPALAVLREMFRKLPNHEREMAIDSLLIGRAITEYSDTFSYGDFLIRNVQSVDPDCDGIVVTDRFQVGQTVRFHVRDEAGADQDFKTLLQRFQAMQPSPIAGLLFTCNGRGTRMFSSANHDSQAIQQQLGDIPLAGLFAAGEFAPIGNRNLTHGFSAVASFLVPRR
jgi:small ligand-binding sensory domain FIST